MQVDKRFMDDILYEIKYGQEARTKNEMLENELLRIYSENTFLIPRNQIGNLLKVYYGYREETEIETENHTLEQVCETKED